MILSNIAKSADLVVKCATTTDQLFFKQIYFHFFNKFVVPFFFEFFVAHTQAEHFQKRLLGDIVINAKNLALVEKFAEQSVQMLSRFQILTERLFN